MTENFNKIGNFILNYQLTLTFMKKVIILFMSCLLLLLLPLNLAAQNANTDAVSEEETVTYGPMDLWGLGLKATTNGVGFELIKGFGERLNIRLGYSTLNIPYSMEMEMEGFEVGADANLGFGGANLLLDYYLVKNVIHVTVGGVYNTMQHTVGIQTLSEFPYGDIMVPADEVGSIQATLSPGLKVSPYAALGFGNTLSRKHRVSFNFELGAMYHGNPQLSLTGEGVIGPMASEHNQNVINEAIAQYQWFPMISMQLSFRII